MPEPTPEALAALRDCPAAHAEALPLLAHLLAAEHVWLSRLKGREPALAVWPQLTLPECEQLAPRNADGLLALVASTEDADFSQAVRYRNARGEEFTTPAIDILTQILLHGPYHRGQIARAIGRAGGEAVNTDFITFARQVEPA